MDKQVLQDPGLTRAKMFQHQIQAFHESWSAPHYALFMEQGTGKTLVILATLKKLWLEAKIQGALIICADGLHHNWKREIAQHLDMPQATVALWDSKMGKQAVKRWEYAASSDEVAFPILLCNIEAIRLERFQNSIAPLLFKRRVITVIDESTCIANPKAQQTKEAFKIGLQSIYTRILSGTPLRNSLCDLWAQCHFLSPTALPYPSYTSFKGEFTEEMTLNFGGRQFTKIAGFKNQEKLIEHLKEFSFRITKKECLDLPEKMYSTLTSPLTMEQWKHYSDLTDRCMLDLPTGPLLITQILPKIIKFQQLCSGWVNDGKDNLIPVDSNRLDVFMQHVNRCPVPSLVFCAFVEDVLRVQKALLEAGHTACAYYGESSSEQRNDAVDGFQGGRYDFFVATRAASKGLTLTRAENVYYYSQGWSLETRLQSEDRAHRIGLKHPVHYVTLSSPGTIDEKIAAALHSKKELAAEILDSEALKKFIACPQEQP